jgi:hypothetical protein
MNKFYQIRGDAFELVEDGRLVNPVNRSFFRVDQVEDVLENAIEIEDLAVWFEKRIEGLKNQISSLQEYLPYADGQAYYQDKNRIVDCQNQIKKIKNYLENA